MRLTLTRKAGKRLRGGDAAVLPEDLVAPVPSGSASLAELAVGQTVELRDDRDHFLGWGLASPASPVPVRLYARNAKADLDSAGFWVARLREALELRHRACPDAASGRVVHGAVDGLPGVFIDRYEDPEAGLVLSVELGTAALEHRADLLQEALLKVLQPQGAWLVGDTPLRRAEGLDLDAGRWLGEVPGVLRFFEHGLACRASLPLHLPHDFAGAEARRFATGRVGGRTVLDLSGTSGAWGVAALAQGAAEVLVVHARELALELAHAAAEDNGVAEGLVLACGDQAEILEVLAEDGQSFEVVFLHPSADELLPDAAAAPPPAADLARALRERAEQAVRRVQPGGLLAVGLRGSTLPDELLVAELTRAARSAGRGPRLLQLTGPAPDHPLLPALLEARGFQQALFQVR